MWNRVRPFLTALIIVVFGLQTASCGYILYPERKGQRGGRIDAGVAVMDGVGLLLFLIPGIVAFAVDFHYGTIYLPGRKSADAGPRATGTPLRKVKFEGKLTPGKVEAILARETGSPVDLDKAKIRIAHARSEDQIRSLLASAE